MYLLLILGAAATFTVGGVFMKLSEGMSRPGPTVGLYLLFAAGATLQTLALRKADLGVAYLFVLGLEAVLAFGFGWWFFAEGCSWWKVLGVAAIVAGIVLLHVDEDRLPSSTSEEPAVPLSFAAPGASDNQR
jgi:small multidrug resistance pump/quaternary ammonium compound-resistance protein SugE